MERARVVHRESGGRRPLLPGERSYGALLGVARVARGTRRTVGSGEVERLPEVGDLVLRHVRVIDPCGESAEVADIELAAQVDVDARGLGSAGVHIRVKVVDRI